MNYYLCGKDVGTAINEGKAIGSFILASLEHEQAAADSSTAVTVGTLFSDSRFFTFEVPEDGIYLLKSPGFEASKLVCRKGTNTGSLPAGLFPVSENSLNGAIYNGAGQLITRVKSH